MARNVGKVCSFLPSIEGGKRIMLNYREGEFFCVSLDRFTIARAHPCDSKEIIKIEYVSISDCNRKERADLRRGGRCSLGLAVLLMCKQYG